MRVVKWLGIAALLLAGLYGGSLVCTGALLGDEASEAVCDIHATRYTFPEDDADYLLVAGETPCFYIGTDSTNVLQSEEHTVDTKICLRFPVDA